VLRWSPPIVTAALVGHIRLNGRDINCDLVAEGHAWVYRRYNRDKSLLDDEQAARDVGSGLWSLPDLVAAAIALNPIPRPYEDQHPTTKHFSPIE
jgi:endonuclease YncB( thermonuclease family)